MQFYDATNKQGICQKADDICDSDDTSYPRVKKTREANNALEQVVGWLINADGKWQFDDTNYTNFPIGTYTLVNSQGVYSFNDKFLQLLDVQVKNVDGVYQIVKPIDQKDTQSTVPLREEFITDGMPLFYDKISDDTIELLPAPDNGVSVTLASGLRIYFKRTASLFTVASDTSADTQTPGFASPYHEILAWMTALPYCMTYKKDRVGMIELKIQQLKEALINHYTKRAKDERFIMTPKGILYI